MKNLAYGSISSNILADKDLAPIFLLKTLNKMEKKRDAYVV